MSRVEYLEQPARSALTKVERMPFKWSLNPYTGCVHRCTFCYVRGFERRAGRPSDHRYGTNVRVKVGIVEQLRRELARRTHRDGVAIGTATDPYQPAEGRYQLTRGCIRELGAARTPISIITRGPMIVRDVDVLQDAARLADVEVHLSIPTVDRDLWRSTEPGTAPPHQRFRAMRVLVDAGIKCGVALAPLLPELSDTPESIRAVLLQARDAGATHAWMNVLNLRPGVREHFLEELAKDYPEQVERYVELFTKAYLPNAYADEVRDVKRRIDQELGGIRDRRIDPILPELQLSLL
ncbi:MAG: radical protein [Thermoleophilia bacterium]|nr:radical protein [Thermoleophilia bacterium]